MSYLGLPENYSPPSRFIKTTILDIMLTIKVIIMKISLLKLLISLIMFIISKATVTKKLGNQTLIILHLTIIKDLNNNKLYIKSYNPPNNAV